MLALTRAYADHRSRLNGVVSALAIVGALSSPSFLRAQGVAGNGGWADMALGYGAVRAFCGICSGGRHVDGYNFQLGAGLGSPHFRFGFGLDIWQHVFPDGKTHGANTAVDATVQFYPLRRGLFMQGGIGLSDYRMLKGLHDGLLFENADTTYFSGIGLSTMAGLGYDIRVSHWIALSPRATYTFGSPHTLRSPNGATVATRSTQHGLEGTVAFVVHSPD